MKTHRSIAAMALAATMLASSIMPAAAAVQPVQVDNDLHITDEDWVQEADGYQGKTSVTFEVVNEGGGGEGPGPGPGGDEDPTIFSAYVPTVLPILMDLDGNVLAPTNAKVINGVEDRAIQVEGMEATATGSMELVSMEEAAEAAPDEKVFGFSLAGEDMTGDMASLPIRIEAAGELDLDMQAEIPAQSEVRAESEIATVLFTLDWADGSGEDVSSSLTVDWENGLLIPGSNKEAVFKWSSTDSNDKLVSVESSNPEIADVADIMTLSAGEYTGQLPVTVNAKSRGTTTITGELQSGETASFKVEVSEYNASGEPSVDIDGELNEGDTLEPGDITVNVPIITPDGEEDTMPVTPDELPSTELKPGDNEIELEVDVNGQTITIIIHINITSSNPSNGLAQSIQEAQAMGFTFSSYEDGLQIDSFENLQFKSEINVPEQIGDFKVLKIGDDVFKDESNIKKITLPDSVKELGDNVFSGCSNLTELGLSNNLTALPDNFISGLTNITQITIPSSVKVIGAGAFSGCTGISSLTIPETVTELGELNLDCSEMDLIILSKSSLVQTSDINVKSLKFDYYPGGDITSFVNFYKDEGGNVTFRVNGTGDYIKFQDEAFLAKEWLEYEGSVWFTDIDGNQMDMTGWALEHKNIGGYDIYLTQPTDYIEYPAYANGVPLSTCDLRTGEGFRGPYPNDYDFTGFGTIVLPSTYTELLGYSADLQNKNIVVEWDAPGIKENGEPRFTSTGMTVKYNDGWTEIWMPDYGTYIRSYYHSKKTPVTVTPVDGFPDLSSYKVLETNFYTDEDEEEWIPLTSFDYTPRIKPHKPGDSYVANALVALWDEQAKVFSNCLGLV
ncbi:leucine-rich repeat domain-containing protein [Intestinimonas butyriciproducens]|uniref:leucine-rich repeat domain-containing protein n=1 Tax=Intestinimonas butyriciproducens TaxID=1297617 RepID=UPI00195EF4BD|nr:leucine-rich repeat domain-containing protein [Intestinimonas butyriciproducens]MBM6977279.1 leucine-rich repeat domain-containing protein [Intestinimonas butyriciproducens]